MMWFIDGFDYLTAANLSLKWDTSPGWTLTTGVYGKGEQLDSANGSPLPHTLSTNYASGMIAIHITVSSFGSNSNLLHSWIDGTTNTSQVELRLDPTGAFYFTRNGTTIGIVGSYRIQTN